MTADFGVLAAAWYALLLDDARRHPAPWWAVALGAIPVLGAALWLVARPSPQASSSSG